MPKNKDLKRLVRARMQKTGEAYTTARQHVLGKQPTKSTTAAARPAAPPVDLAAIAGMRDDSVQAKTGRSWTGWVELLDAAGAAAMTHAAIATLLHEQHGVPGWWSQMVTVGYERIRGKRDKYQTSKGYAVNKSRTFAVPLALLRKAFTKPARQQWLGDEPVTERKSTTKVARWKTADGTWVDVFVEAKGAGKSVASLQHSRLPSRADVERRRAFWAERFDLLGAWLDARK